MVNEVLKLCMSKGFLLDKEMLGVFSKLTPEGAQKVVEVLSGLGISERVITRPLFEKHFDKLKSFLVGESGIEGIVGPLSKERRSPIGDSEGPKTQKVTERGTVKLIGAPAFPQKKIEVKDFVAHFRSRYEKLKAILEQRDFENLSSIRKIGSNHGSYTIIAAVTKKRMTKNKNLFIEVEDLTGTSIVLINQNKKEVFDKARDLLDDDIVAFSVSGTSEMLFANDVIYPEAALQEKRYGEFDEYIAFTGDFHAGSTFFLEKNILRFVKWLNGEEGDEKQRALAKKVRYLLLVGDNVDGVSHYPGQEKFLIQQTSVGQYGKVAEILKLIRKDVQIIICPGQHDSVWIGEPQPIIPERWAPELCKMENVTMVPNPAWIELDGGFKVLMYHGASINRIIEEIPEIRTNFGHSSPTRVVKELLKRRHLSSIHGLMDYIPCEKGDPLVIDPIPDIVATADQHRAEVSIYNNILLIASSCWQSITPFEEKVGNIPDPCKVPLFNLKTREIELLDFSDALKEIEWQTGEGISCSIKDGPSGGKNGE